MKRDARTFITDPDILRRVAGERNILAPKPSLLPKGTAGSALTGQAVANGNAHRLANHPSRELPATA
jgi:hypothetical protein